MEEREIKKSRLIRVRITTEVGVRVRITTEVGVYITGMVKINSHITNNY
jgi:hypothetical protein